MDMPPRYNGYKNLESLFWSKVRKTSTCWVWTGFIFKVGYGSFDINRDAHYAHRTSWELHYGKIPKGMCVCHRCDNRPCVRPSHLFLGTRADNNADAARKGRVAHKLNPEQVKLIRKTFTGKRGQVPMLARQYGMSQYAVHCVVSNKTWRHLL